MVQEEHSKLALNGWHPGERIIFTKLGFTSDPDVMNMWTHVDAEMSAQHQQFYVNRLPFIPIAVLDASGRPWGSILTGKSGKPGFMTSPTPTLLTAESKSWPGDPLLEITKPEALAARHNELLISGIGIESSTRKRNKFAGKITKIEPVEGETDSLNLELTVNQDVAHCPKYITLRTIYPYDGASPKVAYSRLDSLTSVDRLPDEAISFIQSADTAFLGTTYVAPNHEANQYPSHVAMNHRGGRPGFLRVTPSDGRTIVLPDYIGNKAMASLGNIETTPLASLTIMSYTHGHVLYLTGFATNLMGPEAYAIMPLQDRITTIYVTGYTFVKNALPFRSFNPLITPADATDVKEKIQISPYCPPIRYLAEEAGNATSLVKPPSDAHLPKALLTSIIVHSLAPGSDPGSYDIATFTFLLNRTAMKGKEDEFLIRPGQAVVLSLTDLLRDKEYEDLLPSLSDLGDDQPVLRTWSVVATSRWDMGSMAPDDATAEGGDLEFSFTIRLKPSGLATTALFTLVRRLKDKKPHLLNRIDGMKELGMSAGVVGVSGEFDMVEESENVDAMDVDEDVPVNGTAVKTNTKKVTCASGGIGITPFLGMLHALVNQPASATDWDVHFILSTREPEVLVPLISTALGLSHDKWNNQNYFKTPSRRIRIRLDVFSHLLMPDFPFPSRPTILGVGADAVEISIDMHKHIGRIQEGLFEMLLGDKNAEWKEDEYWLNREIYLCGPDKFSRVIVASCPVDVQGRVKMEGFAY
ncbi:hypothetical protein AX17_006659 [Amanita inopinata Kibby_2008]|nr:hypothetical protein AX17_006659 [Amanita inopinata Kibby_2008]